MKITKAIFIKSSPDLNSCPPADRPEYAFVGRSNVGKSSLINMLTGRKKLAKTSETPGKTQLINHFNINDKWNLVDLPGYGFAKASKSAKEIWHKMTEKYIMERSNLLNIFVLIDSRHSPQKNDEEFIRSLGTSSIPFAICFTKMDKLKKSKVEANIKNYCDHLLQQWEELPKMFYTSSKTGKGKQELLDFIDETNKVFKKPY